MQAALAVLVSTCPWTAAQVSSRSKTPRNRGLLAAMQSRSTEVTQRRASSHRPASSQATSKHHQHSLKTAPATAPSHAAAMQSVQQQPETYNSPAAALAWRLSLSATADARASPYSQAYDVPVSPTHSAGGSVGEAPAVPAVLPAACPSEEPAQARVGEAGSPMRKPAAEGMLQGSAAPAPSASPPADDDVRSEDVLSQYTSRHDKASMSCGSDIEPGNGQDGSEAALHTAESVPRESHEAQGRQLRHQAGAQEAGCPAEELVGEVVKAAAAAASPPQASPLPSAPHAPPGRANTAGSAQRPAAPSKVYTSLEAGGMVAAGGGLAGALPQLSPLDPAGTEADTLPPAASTLHSTGADAAHPAARPGGRLTEGKAAAVAARVDPSAALFGDMQPSNAAARG